MRVAGVSAGAVLMFFVLDLYVFAKSHSVLGTIVLGVGCFVSLWTIVLGPGAEIFLPFQRQEYRVSVFLSLLLPFVTMIVYLPLARGFNIDAAARIIRYGVHEYPSFADVRSNFYGLIRIRDAHVNAADSMYYPPD